MPVAAADGQPILLDLGDAHGFDDVVLDVVGQAAHLVACRGERLGIVTRSPYVRRAVDESGLADIVTLYDTLRDAISS